MESWRQSVLGSEAVAPSFLADDIKLWPAGADASTSPKPWSAVELPDLFLTNLMHDIDTHFTDDSLTEFSGSIKGAGSDMGSSPEAYQDFMLRHDSPGAASEERWSPPTPAAPADPLLAPPLFPVDTQPGPSKDAAAAAAAAAAASSSSSSSAAFMSPASLLAAPSVPPAAAARSAPSEQPPTPLTEEALLRPLFMAPGTHASAQDALATLQRRHPPSAQRAGPARAASARVSVPATGRKRAAPVPVAGEDDDASMWSRKSAHNAIERRYRSNINDRIAGLRDVVPALRDMRPRTGRRKRRRGAAEEEELVDGVAAATKLSKATVLSKATEYICYLKSREVRLARDVAGLEMLVRSMAGGDALLDAWKSEMERVHAEHPPADAAYGDVAAPPPAPLDWDDSPADDADDAASTTSSSGDSDRAAQAARYLFGAFLGFSVLSRHAHDAAAPAPAPTAPHVLSVHHGAPPRAPSSWSVVGALLAALGWLALALCLGAAVAAAWQHGRRRQRVAAQRRAVALQDAMSAADVLHTPLEHARAAAPRPLLEAKQVYHAVGGHLQLPRSALGWGARLVVLAARHALGATKRDTHDPVLRRVLDQAMVRRAEMELALGSDVQPSALVRVHSYVALRAVAYGPHGTPDVLALLALYEQDLVQRLGLAWLLRAGAQRWYTAGARLLDADAKAAHHRLLADVLSIPWPVACSYASAPLERGAARVPLSPLARMLDALRSESLAAFWTAMLASMMRAQAQLDAHAPGAAAAGDDRPDADDERDGTAAAAAASGPERRIPVLDIVADASSLATLRQQLADMLQAYPSRGPAAEQLMVAHGTLALVAGHIGAARKYARVLERTSSTLGAAELVALVSDAPLPHAPPARGGTDLLAGLAIGWVRLQRARLSRASSVRTHEATAISEALQARASQCLWTWVSPEPGVRDAKLGMRAAKPARSLRVALDAMMDALSTAT